MEANNMAAMRDALVQCELFLGNVSRHEHSTLNLGDKCTACNGVDELRGMVVRALAAPTRNCDIFKSEDEAKSAFLAYYNEAYDLKGTKDEVDYCDLKHDVDGILHDYVEWLFAPAKTEARHV